VRRPGRLARTDVPVTPFHGGFGLAFKAATGRSFSFLLFACTQIAIDVESFYHFVRGDWPIHRFFHTFLGAAIVSFVAAFALRRPVAALLRRMAARPDLRRWIGSPEISARAAIVTAIVGCLGHVIPDAINHSDVEPFAPFASGNPFHGLVSLGGLYLGLTILGAAGFGAMSFSGPRPNA